MRLFATLLLAGAIPDNPAWKSFKFKLTRVESMDEAAWESFQKKQLQP